MKILRYILYQYHLRNLLQDPVEGGIKIDRGKIVSADKPGLGIESVKV